MPVAVAERRLRTRFRVRVPFVLKGNGQEVRGTTRNISLLGISAYTQGPLPVVQPVQCLLELPQEPQPLTVNGTVIRCEQLPEAHPDGPYEMGVFFKAFQKKGEAALLKYLEQMAQEEQSAIKEGYRVLQQRITARRRRKQLEELHRKRRRVERLRRRRLRLARLERLKAQRLARRAKRKAATAARRRSHKKRVARKSS